MKLKQDNIEHTINRGLSAKRHIGDCIDHLRNALNTLERVDLVYFKPNDRDMRMFEEYVKKANQSFQHVKSVWSGNEKG